MPTGPRPLVSVDRTIQARYEAIRNVIASAIRAGNVQPGQVLLERPISDLFGTSRAPVRRALDLLHDDGLITRFNGRGYLVVGPDMSNGPLRTPLTAAMLGLEEGAQALDTRTVSERIYGDIYTTLSFCVVFGHYQIDEQRAAEHFEVSRSAIREALLRLRESGLVEKEPYGRWGAGPVTARAIREDYELRILLEPSALVRSAPHLTRSTLSRMLARVENLLERRAPPAAELEQAEDELHRDCLAYCANSSLLATLNHARTALTISRLFFEHVHQPVHVTGMQEHWLILRLLLDQQPQSAAEALATHLARAERRTLDRLKTISVFPEPPVPTYVTRLS